MKYPITIIGMGPGNPQLLTLAAKKALDESDVILFDCMPDDSLLKEFNFKAEIKAIDKKIDPTAMLNEMKKHYDMGKKVCRLKPKFFSLSMLGIQLSAFAFGLTAVFIALGLSLSISKLHNQTLVLLLSGIITGSMFGAFISLTKYLADAEYKLPDITFWLMGSLTNITNEQIMIVAPIVLLAIIPLYLSSWKLNVLSFGEEEACSMGVQVSRLRFIVILSATLLTATVVSITGLIGWIGLVVPHIARFLIGSDNRWLLPSAFILGGMFLLLIDLLSRTISALEIPLGIIASIIGAPIFFFVLKSVKSKRNLWE